MHRRRFNTCERQEGESITKFVTRLCDLASHCEYGDSATELIRDRRVCGVRDDTLQLAVSQLTFDKASKLALLHESAAQNARLLSNPTTAPVHYADPSGLPKDPPSGKSCYHCGRNHYAKECRFKQTVCNYCHKKGHIVHICRSRVRHQQLRNSQSPPAKLKQKVKKRHTHKIEGEAEPSSASSTSASPQTPHALPVEPTAEPFPVDYNIFAVGTDKADPYLASMEINGAALQMEIDTGSALTLMEPSQNTGPRGGLRIWRVPIYLKTYSGEELEVVGRAVVRVRCGGQVEEELGLVVVGCKGLGWEWLGRLRLDWREVWMLNATPGALEAVLAKHSNLFRNELGTIRGITAKLHISPGVASTVPAPFHML